MTSDDSRLKRHLLIAVIVKMLALAILWSAFFHERHTARTPEDSAADASAHILGRTSRPGETP